MKIGILSKGMQAKIESQTSKDKEETILANINSIMNNDSSNSLTTILNKCGFNKTYTISEILSNKDESLDIMLNDSYGANYILLNNIDDICSSDTCMQILGKSSYGKYLCASNTEWFNKVKNSTYYYEFDDGSVKVPLLTGASDRVIDSGEYYSSSYFGWNAFDTWNNNTWYNSKNDSAVPKYIGYNFGENVILYKVGYNVREVTMNNITLQGGDASNNWTNIGDYTLGSSTDYTNVKTINISLNTSYTKFRFYVSRTDQLDSYGGLCFQNLQFYCVRVPNIQDINKYDQIQIALHDCGISNSYDIVDLINNKDNILTTILNNQNASNTILPIFIDEICLSDNLMKILSTSTYGKYLCASNTEWFNKAKNSPYFYEFDAGSVKVPILTGVSDKVIDSGEYYSSSYLGWNAFDNWSNNTWYNSQNNSVVPKYIGYNFGENEIIYKIGYNVREISMNKLTLQGGDLSNNWSSLGEYTLEASTDYTKEKTISINSNTSFAKFRFYASRTDQLDSYGGLAFQILQFYCIKAP